MKKLIAIPILALMAMPLIAGTGYEHQEQEAWEEEQYEGTYLTPDEVEEERLEQEQRMEERDQNSSIIYESDSMIDYDDRTRTRRARNAINTGSNASDDE